jgi:protein involved in polysaccharide export with SLBB domain
VRVYVVGDVQRPGAYDISSLSTPLNALYSAGGPTPAGSLRTLQHFRGTQMVQQIDVYDLLLHGVRSDLQRLQAGDTIRVPPLGPQVKIDGMVRRPAVYELNGEKNLSAVLELAGGVLSSGTLRHVDVERIVAHQNRTMLRLDVPETNDQQSVTQALDGFQIEDGDQIRISPIVPYSDKTVFLDGHVFRPGKYAYREGMKVTDIIHSYADLLPEPSSRHAEIIRLEAPDYKPTVLTFSLSDALAGKEQNVALKPFDTIRIFGRYDFEGAPVVTVTGEVRDPGDHLTNGVTHLRDAVFLAGGVAADAELTDAQVFRKTENGKLQVINVSLAKALAGEDRDNILLNPSDRIFIHRSQAKSDPPRVTIQGEVERPGRYPLGEGMSAADLVRVAGGFKRSADLKVADLTSYMEEEGRKLEADHHYIDIAKAMSGTPDTDVRLRDGDVLSIRQMAGWNDVGASVTLQGEVVHPGTYGIHEGERLSSMLERVGGLRPSAYAYGAILQRVQVRQLEEGTRAQLISNVQAEGASLQSGGDPSKAAAAAQWQATLRQLQNTPPTGRLVVHISNDINRWKNTPADVELRAGDVLIIPKQPNFVMINGAVYNPTAITFRSGKSAGWYLSQAGGPTTVANKKAIFVIRANGSVVGNSGGMWSGSVLSTELRPGDMIVVPEKALGGSNAWRNILQASQLVSSVGIAVQVARGF